MMQSQDYSTGVGTPQRFHYDLSHWSFMVGSIGALQTLSVTEIVAGDSVSLDYRAQFRLSPLRHYMYMDAVVDLFAFFVRHREIYGSNWTDFAKSGLDEATTLGVHTFTGSNRVSCCGNQFSAALTLPKWATGGYIKIWNRYFADPQVSGDQKSIDYFTTLTYPDKVLQYGIPVCHLKRSWNTGVPSTLTTADYRVALDGGEINLFDLEAGKARLKTEQGRDWFAVQRYSDILDYTFGTQASVDADERPVLLARSTQWLSALDVDGTDDATLGRSTGKAAGIMSLKFPPKFFNEHGALWIMGVVRFPPVCGFEASYLSMKSEPTYKQIFGDPEVLRREQPVTLTANEVFAGGAALDLGKIPYAQWYREHPHHVHAQFLEVAGHPFTNSGLLTTRANTVYVVPANYDNVFATTQLEHWQALGHVDIQAKRYIPKPEDSIFAGTR